MCTASHGDVRLVNITMNTCLAFSSEKTRHFQPMISELCHYEISCIPVHIEEHLIPKMLIYHELAKQS